MCRFIYLFVVVALLWLLETKSTKFIRKKKTKTNKEKQKTANFNRGEYLGSPLTGYGPVLTGYEREEGETSYEESENEEHEVYFVLSNWERSRGT